MLTSHLYSLSGFLVAAYATGLLSGNFTLIQTLQDSAFEAPNQTTFDVVYRGSGRLDESSSNEETASAARRLAHRGSGRIEPRTVL